MSSLTQTIPISKNSFWAEYRLTVNPVILGQGMPIFENVKDRADLNLLGSKTFNSGVIALHYETKR